MRPGPLIFPALLTTWLQASNNAVMTYTLTNFDSDAQFYRVQVRP